VTAVTLGRPTAADTWAIGAPRLLAGLDRWPALDHAQHLSVHGPAPAVSLDRLLALLDACGLAGRGGAGFPLAAKVRALRNPKRILVNGSESEPLSQKDRTLLTRTPHLVLDGAAAVAGATGARDIAIAVHDRATAEPVLRAAAERRMHVRVDVVGGGFVAGEARAVVRHVEGGPALPPGRRDLPTDRGVLVSNVETLAHLAVLIRTGAARFATTGTRDEPGTTLLTVSGAVARPGVVEVPLGTPLGIVLAAAGAAESQAVVVGGYHGAWLPPVASIALSRAGVAAAGGSFGAGVVQVVDHATCALGELAGVCAWLAAQSAQQCGPCRFGLPALASDVAAMVRGESASLDRALAHGRVVQGRGACAHPDGAVRFVSSALHQLHDEVDAHRRGGCGRPVLGRLAVAR
jgi:NADH:ubiquinone oxidoreductase subunit F (NADH-binding)